jgi:hypothetical protein
VWNGKDLVIDKTEDKSKILTNMIGAGRIVDKDGVKRFSGVWLG